MRIYNREVVGGKIDHIDIGNNTEIDCLGCLDLIELPDWPHVRYIKCDNCPGLTVLPNWSHVKLVTCYHCPGLVTLGYWPNAVSIVCFHTNLTKLFRVSPTVIWFRCVFVLSGKTFIFDNDISDDSGYRACKNNAIRYRKFYNYKINTLLFFSKFLPYDLTRLLIGVIKYNCV